MSAQEANNMVFEIREIDMFDSTSLTLCVQFVGDITLNSTTLSPPPTR